MLKYFAIFLLTLCVTGLGALSVASYYGISQLHEQMPKDHNLGAVAKISEGYLKELETFDSLFAQVQGKKMPALCSTICNPVGLDQEELINGKTDYLESYYKETGNKAFKDPLFRFKLEQMSLVSRTLPPSVRSVVNDILKEEGRDQRNKLWLAVRLETSVLMSLPGLSSRLQTFKEHSEQLEQLRTMIKACHTGTSPKKISSQCESLQI
ncbi:MAG: hypothetical protein J7501_02980 [Bdellovibrio sp.]|nr:hypothetical protein [Bdellovibrio sp.]